MYSSGYIMVLCCFSDQNLYLAFIILKSVFAKGYITIVGLLYVKSPYPSNGDGKKI